MTDTQLVKAAEAGLPAVADYLADAQGRENEVKAGSMAVPFFRILQKGSPQVDPEHGSYISGAKVGDFVNTVTRQTFDGKIGGQLIVPVKYDWYFGKWQLREEGGGPRGRVSLAEGNELRKTVKRDEKNREILSDGLELVETMEWLSFHLVPDSVPTPVMVTFAKTSLKKVKAWNTIINNLVSPDGKVLIGGRLPFAGQYLFTTIREEKDGNSWQNYNIVAAGYAPLAIYSTAKELSSMLISGAAKVETVDVDHDNNAPGDATKSGGKELDSSDEVPF